MVWSSYEWMNTFKKDPRQEQGVNEAQKLLDKGAASAV